MFDAQPGACPAPEDLIGMHLGSSCLRIGQVAPCHATHPTDPALVELVHQIFESGRLAHAGCPIGAGSLIVAIGAKSAQAAVATRRTHIAAHPGPR